MAGKALEIRMVAGMSGPIFPDDILVFDEEKAGEDEDIAHRLADKVALGGGQDAPRHGGGAEELNESSALQTEGAIKPPGQVGDGDGPLPEGIEKFFAILNRTLINEDDPGVGGVAGGNVA